MCPPAGPAHRAGGEGRLHRPVRPDAGPAARPGTRRRPCRDLHPPRHLRIVTLTGLAPVLAPGAAPPRSVLSPGERDLTRYWLQTDATQGLPATVTRARRREGRPRLRERPSRSFASAAPRRLPPQRRLGAARRAAPGSVLDERRLVLVPLLRQKGLAGACSARWHTGMSRFGQVLARYEDEVMEPLTRDDETRTWRGEFTPIPDWLISGWHLESFRLNQRRGVLADLEALPWKEPECVQVMFPDEDDDVFGMWMFQDGELAEVQIPRTKRIHHPPSREGESSWPGTLWRTDGPNAQGLTAHSPEHEQNPRLSW